MRPGQVPPDGLGLGDQLMDVDQLRVRAGPRDSSAAPRSSTARPARRSSKSIAARRAPIPGASANERSSAPIASRAAHSGPRRLVGGLGHPAAGTVEALSLPHDEDEGEQGDRPAGGGDREGVGGVDRRGRRSDTGEQRHVAGTASTSR